MQGIYVIRNTINGKMYVGSSINIINRTKDHKSALQNNKHQNRYLQSSVNKYGIDNFTFNLLERVDDYNQLEQRENHWCQLLDVHNSKFGYNLAKVVRTQGPTSNEYRKHLSDLTTNKVRVYMVTPEGVIVNIFESAVEASKTLNIHTAHIWLLITGQVSLFKGKFMLFKGFTFTTSAIKARMSKKRTNVHSKKTVYQFDSHNNLLNTYSSQKEAIEQNTNIAGIVDALKLTRKNKSQQAGEYFWTYDPSGPKSFQSPLKREGRTIQQLSLDGVLIQEYASIGEVVRTTTFKKKGIEKVLYGENKTYKGFLWK